MRYLLSLFILMIAACNQQNYQWRSVTPNNPVALQSAYAKCVAIAQAESVRAESEYLATERLIGAPKTGGFWGGVNDSFQRGVYADDIKSSTLKSCMANNNYVLQRVSNVPPRASANTRTKPDQPTISSQQTKPIARQPVSSIAAKEPINLYDLGVKYERGIGVSKDYVEAVKYYRLGAEQGHTMSQYNLGVLYMNGDGIPQNYAEAIKWYSLAAEHNYSQAQYNLGFMYGNGLGVTKNLVLTHMWWSLSSIGGNETAINDIDTVEMIMTFKQIAEAQKMTRKWLREH